MASRSPTYRLASAVSRSAEAQSIRRLTRINDCDIDHCGLRLTMEGTRHLKEIVTSLTQRGQVTVPAEVRRLLGLKPRDKVAFTIDDDQVRLRPATFTIDTAFGSVPPKNRPEDFEA